MILRNVTSVDVERIAVTSQEQLTSPTSLNNTRDVINDDENSRCVRLLRWSEENLLDQLPLAGSKMALLALHVDAMTSHATTEVQVSFFVFFQKVKSR